MTLSDGSKGDTWLGLGGRVCAVTGAAGGIGSEISRHLGRAGAHVVLLDLDQARGKALAGKIEADGGRAIGLRCDVGNPDSVTAAAEASEKALGPCRVLVNN